jgi:hypothetical protein
MATVDDVFDKLVELQGDFREHKGRTEERLDSLEDSRQNWQFWQNLKIVAIIPITASIHIIASKIGLIKG